MDENDVGNDDEAYEIISESEMEPLHSEDNSSSEGEIQNEDETSDKDLCSDLQRELLQQLKKPVTDDERELLMIHEKCKHLPEPFLHRMAKAGEIPRKFAKVKLPPCPACIFGKQHRRPWRSKGSQSHIRKKGQVRAGDGTSVDQLESRHPGLVPQSKGFHRTTERFVGATIFVDHATSFTYVHLIKDFTGEENMEAKQAYETKASEHGVRIRVYHGDNGRFAEALWVTDAAEKR